MSILICPFDGTSHLPGSSVAADLIWKSFFSNVASDQIKRVCFESKNSALYCTYLKRVATKHNYRLAIGGEHLITMPLVEAWRGRYSNLKLIVFDAHHDSYPYPLATNYTVFHYIAKELGAQIMYLGLRHETERASQRLHYLSDGDIRRLDNLEIFERISEFLNGSPFYVSLDLDVIDPKKFGAVSSPVAGGIGVDKATSILDFVLNLAPVAVDVVEYNPLKDSATRQALKAITPIFHVLKEWYDRGVSRG